jgi:hypothetical protein
MTTSTPVTLVAGCRRTMADCRNKHLPVGGDTEGLAGNFKNFGATPHIPPQNGVMTSTVECK